jgi:hypothetical protein
MEWRRKSAWSSATGKSSEPPTTAAKFPSAQFIEDLVRSLRELAIHGDQQRPSPLTLRAADLAPPLREFPTIATGYADVTDHDGRITVPVVINCENAKAVRTAGVRPRTDSRSKHDHHGLHALRSSQQEP